MPDSSMPRILALAWGLEAAPQRGPKRELSLERIVDAAIEIADAEGIAAVTMQRVAKVFGFSTMALYRYVSTKDDLHQLMFDAALSESSAPIATVDDDDWRAGLGALLRGLVAAYRAHPWALDISLTPDVHFMPGQMRFVDTSLRAMRDLPVSGPTKLGVLVVVSAFARGLAAVEREVLAGTALQPEIRALIEEAVRTAGLPDLRPLVASGAYFDDESRGAAPDPAVAVTEANAILDFGAQVLLAGLDVVIEQMPPESDEVAPPLDPVEQLEAAEAELVRHRELRKQAQRRVQQLEREEAALQKARDRAKELAKAHAKFAAKPDAD